jgi:hypothetical protein
MKKDLRFLENKLQSKSDLKIKKIKTKFVEGVILNTHTQQARNKKSFINIKPLI